MQRRAQRNRLLVRQSRKTRRILRQRRKALKVACQYLSSQLAHVRPRKEAHRKQRPDQAANTARNAREISGPLSPHRASTIRCPYRTTGAYISKGGPVRWDPLAPLPLGFPVSAGAPTFFRSPPRSPARSPIASAHGRSALSSMAMLHALMHMRSCGPAPCAQRTACGAAWAPHPPHVVGRGGIIA